MATVFPPEACFVVWRPTSSSLHMSTLPLLLRVVLMRAFLPRYASQVRAYNGYCYEWGTTNRCDEKFKIRPQDEVRLSLRSILPVPPLRLLTAQASAAGPAASRCNCRGRCSLAVVMLPLREMAIGGVEWSTVCWCILHRLSR